MLKIGGSWVVAACSLGALLGAAGCGVDQSGLKEIEQRNTMRDGAVSDVLVPADGGGGRGLDAAPAGSGGDAGTPDATPGSGGAGGNNVPGSGGMLAAGGMGGRGSGTGGRGTGGSGGLVPGGTGGDAGGAGGQPGDVGGGGGSAAGGSGGGMAGGAAGGGATSGAAGGGATGGAAGGGATGGAAGGSAMGGAGGGPFVCACGACQRCSTTGSCEVDPQSHWQMTAVSASLNPVYPGGGNWDVRGQPFGGPLPDPFAQFEMPVGAAIGWTSTLIDSTMPMWNEPLQPAGTKLTARDLLPGGMLWQIWIGDEDENGNGEVMCELNGPITAADFAAGGFTRTNVSSCYAVQIALACVP